MDCDDCDCDCPGDCDCDCDCCVACCVTDCCEGCLEACCQETNCCGCGACSCCCSTKCCCRFVTALFAIAVATLIVVLVVAYAGVLFPARVTVEDAYLGRLALVDPNGTALAYDVSLTIAVRNRNFATGVWKTAPLDAELRFRGQTFARASAKLESAEWGLFNARGKGMYRVTASSADSGGAPAVALGGDGVAEFVRESVAGVFELELAVVGGEVKDEEQHHGRDSSIRVTCPLKLSLPTATAQVIEFTRVKCT